MDFRLGCPSAEDPYDPVPKAHGRLPIQGLFGLRAWSAARGKTRSHLARCVFYLGSGESCGRSDRWIRADAGQSRWTCPKATSASGPSQHFAPPHDFGRKRGIAEVDWQPSIAEGDARDPQRTWRTRLLVHFVGARGGVQSTTTSARRSIDSGSVSPIARAVPVLTASVKVTGCSIGRSAGLAPRSTLFTSTATCR
jgi:hypothetical protein